MNNIPSRYIPLDSHDSGGFSDVFFFYDTNLERNVAIKSIRDIAEISRLQDEISALMQLRSKHVVQVYDVIPPIDNVFGIVMEYINGYDLFHLPKELKQPNILLKILWQIASGITDIHNSGIIHRDIKPNNMKIDEEGIVKIFDFGLARNQGFDAKTVGFKGTRGFSSPEQYTYTDVRFTSAIDIYAFGVTAVYLITECFPPELLNIPPLPIAKGVFNNTFLEDYSDLMDVFEMCLDHNPDNRPKIEDVTSNISKYLLLNKHQALTVYAGNSHILNSTSRSVRLSLENIGACELYYDGMNFEMIKVVGEVYVNNILINNNYLLTGACVIAIGNSRRHANERRYITFDISNPEVIL
jgi:serine/threonine-protein kinase